MYIYIYVRSPAKDIRAATRSLDNYFTPQAAGDALPEVEELHIPDVATDVRSTYLRLHAKRHIYADDQDFPIVKDTLSMLRGNVSKEQLHKMMIDPQPIRQYFKEKFCGNIHFHVSSPLDEATGAQAREVARCQVHPSHTWRTYYVTIHTTCHSPAPLRVSCPCTAFPAALVTSRSRTSTDTTQTRLQNGPVSMHPCSRATGSSKWNATERSLGSICPMASQPRRRSWKPTATEQLERRRA